MLTIPPSEFRKRRGRLKQTAPTPALLTLISAVFDGAGPIVTLTFDRAIDVAAFAGGEFLVLDQINGDAFDGSGGAVLDGPATVVITLVAVGSEGPGANVLFTAGAGNGIVAVGDGAAWAGVSELELPFP